MTSKELFIYLAAAVVFFAMGVAVGEAKAGEVSITTGIGLYTKF